MRPPESAGTSNTSSATWVALADFPHVRRALHLVAEDKQAYYSEAEKVSPCESSKEIQLKILIHVGTAHSQALFDALEGISDVVLYVPGGYRDLEGINYVKQAR